MDKLDNFVVNNKRLIGIITASSIAYLACKILKGTAGLVNRFLLPGHNLIERYGNGSYAAITACTDGIGKGFAIQLAKKGFNLVMFVRNAEKAQIIAQDIKKTINDKIDIRIVVVDFDNCNSVGAIENAVKQVEDVDISLLVNNVGVTFNTGQLSFEKLKDKDLLQIINVNIVSHVLFTNKILQRFSQRSKKCGIINMSSITIHFHMPGFAMYGATKIFNDYFSRSLAVEYKGKVDFLSIRPGWVDTPMVSAVKTKPLVITPEECAEVALRLLGRFEYTPGHYRHIMATFLQGVNLKSINKRLFNVVKKEREADNQKIML